MTVGKTVRIGKSRIKGAGRGVFALVDLKAGEKITKYEGRLVPTDEPRTDEEMAYSINYNEKIDLIGYSTRRRWRGIGAASLINDALCPAIQERTKKSPYFTRSQKRRTMNCCLQSNRSSHELYAVATRDIVAGEELYTSYQWCYWKGYFANDKLQRRHVQMHDITAIVMEGYGSFMEVPDSCYHPDALKMDALRISWKGLSWRSVSCPCTKSCQSGRDLSTSYVWKKRTLTIFCHTCHGSIQRFVE